MWIDPRIASALNSAFVADPSGDETLATLASAWRETVASTRVAEARAARERAAEAQQRQADAQAAQAARVADQERSERLRALAAVAGMWRREPPEPLVLDRSCDFEADRSLPSGTARGGERRLREAPVSGSNKSVLDSDNVNVRPDIRQYALRQERERAAREFFVKPVFSKGGGRKRPWWERLSTPPKAFWR